jgi:hypothetical protein
MDILTFIISLQDRNYLILYSFKRGVFDYYFQPVHKMSLSLILGIARISSKGDLRVIKYFIIK